MKEYRDTEKDFKDFATIIIFISKAIMAFMSLIVNKHNLYFLFLFLEKSLTDPTKQIAFNLLLYERNNTDF